MPELTCSNQKCEKYGERSYGYIHPLPTCPKCGQHMVEPVNRDAWLVGQLRAMQRLNEVAEAKIQKLQSEKLLLMEIANEAATICSVFEVHEYPEVEALSVVDKVKELLEEGRSKWRWYGV